MDSGLIEVDIRRVALCFLPIGLPRMSCLALARLLACLSSPLAPPSVRGKKNSNQAEIIRDREEKKSDGQADVSQKDHLLLSSLTASLSQQEGFVEE